MNKSYLQYEIAKRKGFYGVYFDSRFLIGVDSLSAAKKFVDRRVSERLSLLISAEFEAMSDKALTSIDGELAYKKGNPNLGWLFYEISQEATTHFEIEIVNSVVKEIPCTMAFGIGYSDAQDALLSHSEDRERQAYTDNQQHYHEQLMRELEVRRNSFSDEVLELMASSANPANYSELLSLPIEVRKLLAEIEEMNVNLEDYGDEYIDGRTSGHHREIRDILLCAANDRPIAECHADIYMSAEGEFNYNLIDHVSEFSGKHVADNR